MGSISLSAACLRLQSFIMSSDPFWSSDLANSWRRSLAVMHNPINFASIVGKFLSPARVCMSTMDSQGMAVNVPCAMALVFAQAHNRRDTSSCNPDTSISSSEQLR